MGITHIPVVAAALYQAGGKARNAADVGPGRDIFRGAELVEPLGALYHPGLRLNFRGVYGAVVDALNHGAEILPGNASHIVLPGHRATERTVDDAAAALVEPHKAAHRGAADDNSLKGTVHDLPVTDSHKAAHGIGIPRG